MDILYMCMVQLFRLLSGQVTIWRPASLGRGKVLEMVIAGNHVRNEKS